MTFKIPTALALLFFTATPVFAAETVETYFVKNNKVPYGTMTAGPMVGTYGTNDFEVGGKFSIEPFPKGFVEPINDSVSFEAGIFRGQSEHWTRLVTSIAMRWDFNLIPLWTVFGAPGISVKNEEHDEFDRNRSSNTLALSLGAFLNISQAQAVRLELDLRESATRAGYIFKF